MYIIEMPLEQSDRIRRIQEKTIFGGWAVQQQVEQPGVNVSTCTTFYQSTIHKFNTFEYAQQVTSGRPLFNACTSNL